MRQRQLVSANWLASAVPVSGSSYSYTYATMGEIVAFGVAACLLLEYGVSSAAVSVGWAQYLDELFSSLFGILFLLAADILARWLVQPYELPVGTRSIHLGTERSDVLRADAFVVRTVQYEDWRLRDARLGRRRGGQATVQ